MTVHSPVGYVVALPGGAYVGRRDLRGVLCPVDFAFASVYDRRGDAQRVADSWVGSTVQELGVTETVRASA